VAAGNAWTISVWYKNTMATNGITATSGIVTQLWGNGNLNIALGDVGGGINLGFRTSDGTWYNGASLSSYFTQNTWVHLVGTWNGTNLRTYINNSLIENITPGGTSVDAGTNYRIGRRWDGANYVTGEIGEVRILSRALGDADVTKTYMENFPAIMGLKAWYSAADYSGTGAWADKTGSGRSATILHGTAAKNFSSNSIIFDGATSWTFPNPAVGNAWTVSVWYKKDITATGFSVILSQILGGAMNIFMYDNTTITAGFKAMNDNGWKITEGIPVTKEIWTNIQTSWDGTTIRTYVNGVLHVSATPGAGTISADNGTAYVLGSGFEGGPSNFIKGEIAEVRIYNRALSEAEITSVFDETNNIQLNVTTGLQLWLDAKDNSTMTITGASTVTQWRDKSGLLNNSTAVGTPQLGANGITFNDSSYFNLADGSLPYNDTDFTMYIIVRSPSGNAGLLTAGGGLYIAYDVAGASLGFQGYNGGGTYTNFSIASALALYTVTYSSSGYNYKQYINGTQYASTNGSGPRNQTSSPNQLGVASYPARGMIVGEMLAFNGTHTTTQRQNVEGYLMWKWGIQTTLPSSHLYYNYPPRRINTPNLQIYLRATNYSGSGAWIDESGSGRDATLENGVIAKNAEGNGIVLNGSTSWTFPNVRVTNKWTANVWYKNTANHSAGACIVTQGMGYYQLNCMIGDWAPWGNTTKVAGTFLNGPWAIGDEITLVNNVWTNIQIVNNGTHIITYIDGTLLGSVPAYNGISAIDNGLDYLIGRGSPGYMVGEIGELRIYNKALSASDVTAAYNESLATFSS
jgi:hypothetical protein